MHQSKDITMKRPKRFYRCFNRLPCFVGLRVIGKPDHREHRLRASRIGVKPAGVLPLKDGSDLGGQLGRNEVSRKVCPRNIELCACDVWLEVKLIQKIQHALIGKKACDLAQHAVWHGAVQCIGGRG